MAQDLYLFHACEYSRSEYEYKNWAVKYEYKYEYIASKYKYLKFVLEYKYQVLQLCLASTMATLIIYRPNYLMCMVFMKAYLYCPMPSLSSYEATMVLDSCAAITSTV